MAGFFSSSIGKKFIMSLSGLFLITFLAVHLTVNMTMLWGPETYNRAAHFMATNPFIRVMEPILALGFIFHIVYAFILEINNYFARGKVRYDKEVRGHTSTWASRNMIWLGLMVLVFLVIHLANFFWKVKFGELPEVTYGTETMHDTYALVVGMFQQWLWVDVLYVVGAIALGLHLHHAFWSSFQTLGWSNEKWRKRLSVIGDIYAVVVSVGFAFLPIYFYLIK